MIKLPGFAGRDQVLAPPNPTYTLNSATPHPYLNLQL
jgi:hypothetical protein